MFWKRSIRTAITKRESFFSLISLLNLLPSALFRYKRKTKNLLKIALGTRLQPSETLKYILLFDSLMSLYRTSAKCNNFLISLEAFLGIKPFFLNNFITGLQGVKFPQFCISYFCYLCCEFEHLD